MLEAEGLNELPGIIMQIERILSKYGSPPKEGMPINQAWGNFLSCLKTMDERLENFKASERADDAGKEI